MKKLLLFIPLIAFGAATQALSNYQLLGVNSNANTIYKFTATGSITF